MPNHPDHFVLVCATCKGPRSFAQMTGALRHRLPPGFALRPVDCMAGCDRPATVGFQAAGKAQYLFGDIRTDADVAALAEFARQYQLSSDGWTNATDRPRALFKKTLSRIPPILAEVPL